MIPVYYKIELLTNTETCCDISMTYFGREMSLSVVCLDGDPMISKKMLKNLLLLPFKPFNQNEEMLETAETVAYMSRMVYFYFKS